MLIKPGQVLEVLAKFINESDIYATVNYPQSVGLVRWLYMFENFYKLASIYSSVFFSFAQKDVQRF